MKRFPCVLALLAACRDASAPPILTPQLAIVAGDVQADTVMRTLPVQLAAQLTDKASGAPIGGHVISWVVVDGGGTVFASISETGSDGIARQSWTLGPRAGSQRLVARWLDPETGDPVTLDTAVATATPDTAARFSLIWNTDSTLHPALDTIAVRFGYGDPWANVTGTCGGGRDPNALAWSVSGGYPYGADSLVRPFGVDPQAHALMVEIGGYQPSQGTTVWLHVATACVQAGRDSTLLRFDTR